MTGGRGYYNGNSVSAGQGFLIYPGQYEEYFADENDPWEFLWIVSADEKMKDIFERYRADPKTLVFDYGSVTTLKGLAEKIVKNSGKVFDSLEMCGMYMHIINSHVKKDVFSETKADSDIYFGFCADYIETHIGEKITVANLAELAGISEVWLRKIFVRKSGMSVKRYIISRRVDYAKKMLAETNLPVTRIAEFAGYDDVLGFSKMFKKEENISPRKYRDKIKSGDYEITDTLK